MQSSQSKSESYHIVYLLIKSPFGLDINEKKKSYRRMLLVIFFLSTNTQSEIIRIRFSVSRIL